MRVVTLVSICGLLALAQGRVLLEEESESPRFKVVNSTDSLELREYSSATWAIAFGKSRWSIDLASFYAGKALVSYFSGHNVAHTAIKPTVPLIATILFPPHHKHGNGSHPSHDNGTHPHHPPHHHHGPPAVALAAYIPSEFKGVAPIPDCPLVKILHTNKTDVYVHKFGGWAFPSFVVKHEIGHLALALKDIGVCPFSGKFFVATYQGPFQIFGRRNEVLWVRKPKHHNDTTGQDGEWDAKAVGLAALDAELLFPEQFPIDEEPTKAELPMAVAAAVDVRTTQQDAALDVVQVS